MLADQIIYGVIVPALIAGVIALTAGRIWRSAVRGEWIMAGAAVAVAAGYVAGQVLLVGWPGKPVEAWQWLPYIALTACALSASDWLRGRWAWLRRGSELAFVAAVVVLMLSPEPFQSWTRGQAWAWVGGLGAAAVTYQWSLGSLVRRLRDSTAALLMSIVGTGSSIILISSSNARLGQLAGVLTAAIGAVMVAGWIMPRVSLAGGAARVSAVLLCGLLLNGYSNDYTELPVASFILIAAAPSCAWLAELKPVHRLGNWPIFIIRAALVLIPTAIAATLAWRVYSAMETYSY